MMVLLLSVSQELEAKLCKKTGKTCNGHCSNSGPNNHQCSDQMAKSIRIVGATTQWLKPTCLTDLIQFINQHLQDNCRLVFGNTSFGELYILLFFIAIFLPFR